MKTLTELPYKSIALCGYRQKGQALYQRLTAKDIKVPYVIERNYQSLSLLPEHRETCIVGFDKDIEFYVQAEAILLTGDLPEEIVREALQFVGIEIPVITEIEV